MRNSSNVVMVSGAAGFIGSALVSKLLALGYSVIGVDNHNSFYDGGLKELRLNINNSHENYTHLRIDISDYEKLHAVFRELKPSIVVNLAAIAGVRHSVERPLDYIASNINGFANIIECSRIFLVKHFIYSSSSSVYGAEKKIPFNANQKTDSPINIYAATKKSNELIAHAYSHLYGLKTTGFRFFTAYGPWGRPDMALFKFVKAINENTPIKIYNNGAHKRDFTYIDDIISGILCVLESGSHKDVLYEILNLGKGTPVSLIDFIESIEICLGKKSIRELLPAQDGDMQETFADISPMIEKYGYMPKVDYRDGVEKFVEWYLAYQGEITHGQAQSKLN
jgi:UDP-glucuronate 4-epimerase